MIIKGLLKLLERSKPLSYFDHNIEIFNSSKGYGIRAIVDLAASQTLIKIPKDIWKDEFSASAAVTNAQVSNPDFFKHLNNLATLVLPNNKQQADNLIKSSCLAIKLIVDPFVSKHSYIEFLNEISYPVNSTLQPHPLVMKDFDSNNLLKGSSTYRTINMRKKMYNYIGESLFGKDNAISGRFKWAVSVILSRALSRCLCMSISLYMISLCITIWLCGHCMLIYSINIACSFYLLVLNILQLA